MIGERSRKPPTQSDLGRRLVALRKAQGLTQVQLAEATGASSRAISSYETDVSYPPVPVIATWPAISACRPTS